MKFIELSWKSGIDEGTLLGMAASHKLTCPMEKVKKIATALGVTLEEFFMAAREEYFGSFFITKTSLPTNREVRSYARQGLYLHKQKHLKYDSGFKANMHSPPVESLQDAFIATITIEPDARLTDWKLARNTDIHISVTKGGILIGTDSENSEDIVAGQSIVFDGAIKHSIRNISKDSPAEILLSFTTTDILTKKAFKSETGSTKEFDTPILLTAIHKRLSANPENKMPVSEMAMRAGLNPRDLDPLINGTPKNLPVEKLIRLSELLEIPFETLISEQPLASKPLFRISKGMDRGTIDYRPQHGIMFYPWLKLGETRNRFFAGQAVFGPTTAPMIESRSSQFEDKNWEGKSYGSLFLKGWSGTLGVDLGIRHAYAELEKGDTVYLDMSLGYVVRNLSPVDTTSFFTIAYPSIL